MGTAKRLFNESLECNHKVKITDVGNVDDLVIKIANRLRVEKNMVNFLGDTKSILRDILPMVLEEINGRQGTK